MLLLQLTFVLQKRKKKDFSFSFFLPLVFVSFLFNFFFGMKPIPLEILLYLRQHYVNLFYFFPSVFFFFSSCLCLSNCFTLSDLSLLQKTETRCECKNFRYDFFSKVIKYTLCYMFVMLNIN